MVLKKLFKGENLYTYMCIRILFKMATVDNCNDEKTLSTFLLY